MYCTLQLGRVHECTVHWTHLVHVHMCSVSTYMYCTLHIWFVYINEQYKLHILRSLTWHNKSRFNSIVKQHIFTWRLWRNFPMFFKIFFVEFPMKLFLQKYLKVCRLHQLLPWTNLYHSCLLCLGCLYIMLYSSIECFYFRISCMFLLYLFSVRIVCLCYIYV